MNRRVRWTIKLFVVAFLGLLSQSVNGQCDSGICNSVPNAAAVPNAAVPMNYGVAEGTCASGNCGGPTFGYPGRGCSAGHGHRNGPLKQHAQHLAEAHQRDFARNQAWPKPFDCADRQLYFAIWEPMVETGLRWNCVFSAEHFNPDTNQLNSAGRAKVAGIFKNHPSDQKIALVQNDGNASVVDSRLANLKSTINKWYGRGTFMEVAKADVFPGAFNGSRVEVINHKSGEETPPPVIPVATGTGSTSDVGVGQ